MRATAIGVATSLLLLVAVVGPATAAPSERFPLEPITFEIVGSCPFPVLVADDFAKGQIRVSEDASGNVLMRTSGVVKGTMTNTQTGESIRYTLAGNGRFRFNADGTAITRVTGSAMAWYDAAQADVSDLGQGIFFVHGQAHERYNAAGELVDTSVTGRITDVCGLLAPDV